MADVSPIFRELIQSSIGHALQQFGKNIAPLSMIGHFLNFAGNHLLQFIHQNHRKRIFFPLHFAESIHLLSNGDVLTKVKKVEFGVFKDQETQEQQIRCAAHESQFCFRSKAVVICDGGVQNLPAELSVWFPTFPKHKIISSDELLKSEGYMKVMNMLR